ncbi:MAG: GAF domain-containing protein, partial [Anaerolineales bacterium]|nr:GAF domain-containing protein [Anaerolineales bacterium]
ARAINFSAEFTQAWKTIPQEDRERIQAYHSETPVLVPDVSISKLSQPIIEQMHAEGIYAFADFPLITPSGTIGQLSVYFSEPQRFQTDQVDMLKTFAAQAALAVANARAHAETDQALRRRVDQLAALDAVGREMTAMLNTDELFEVILTHALNVPKTTIGHLSIYEPESEGLRIVAHRGYPTDSPVTDSNKIHPTNLGVLGRVYQSAEICNVPDVLQDSYCTDRCASVTRSLLAIPILSQGRVLGVITVEASTLGAFTEDHEFLLAQIAQQAAVALANATLYQQIETHFREQSLLYQASTQIAASYESEAVALAVADSMAVALSADGARVSRWNPVSCTLISQAAIQDGKPVNGHSHESITTNDVPTLATCLKESKTVQWSLKDAPSAGDHRYLAEFCQAGTLLAVPLIVGDQTLGLIEVFNHAERFFDQNAIRTAQTIASQAAIALENTDLFRRIRESHNLLMAVLNSTQEGMLMADTQGKIVLANQQLETLTGLRVDELVGSNLSEEKLQMADHLGYQSDELANILTTLRSRQPLQWGISTFEVEHPSRSTLQRSEAPVHDINDQLIGWLVVLRDISEERELSQTREQLTEMIVHDLRSPLTTILGSIKLLDKAQADDEASPVIKQALSISNHSVQQMLGLVNSLLDIAKLESGELSLSLQSLSLDVLCEELVENFVYEANEDGIILNLNVA